MIEEIDDISDEKWNKLIASKRHKEIANLLKQVISGLKKEEDKGVANAILKNNDVISIFYKKLNEIQKYVSPEKNIENNNNELAEGILTLSKISKDIVEGQSKIIELLSIKPVRLRPNSDRGFIQYVDVEWKSITNKK